MQLTLVPHYGLYYYEYETHCTITCSDLNSVMYPQLNVIQSVLFTPHFLACPQSSLPDPLPFAALITHFYFSITLIARYCYVAYHVPKTLNPSSWLLNSKVFIIRLNLIGSYDSNYLNDH